MNIGISQRELGIRIGIDPNVSSARINQYERGKNEPSFGVVRLLARELGVPAAYFYAEDDLLAASIRSFPAIADQKKLPCETL